MNTSSLKRCYSCGNDYTKNAGNIINTRCAESVPGSFHRNEYTYVMKPQWICIYCQMKTLNDTLKELEKKVEQVKKAQSKLESRISIQSVRNK